MIWCIKTYMIELKSRHIQLHMSKYKKWRNTIQYVMNIVMYINWGKTTFLSTVKNRNAFEQVYQHNVLTSASNPLLTRYGAFLTTWSSLPDVLTVSWNDYFSGNCIYFTTPAVLTQIQLQSILSSVKDDQIQIQIQSKRNLEWSTIFLVFCAMNLRNDFCVLGASENMTRLYNIIHYNSFPHKGKT